MQKMLLVIFLISISLFAQTESIEKILNEDGTIKTGENGSYNVDGYVLQCGENNQPKLLKNSESTTNVVWEGIGEGRNGFNSNVKVILVVGEAVYFGGDFTYAGDINVNHIVKWTPNTDGGGTWSALGSGVNNTVYALVANGTDLYVGGSFTTAGGNAANRVAKWNGTSWSALESGLNGGVSSLAVSGTDLYVGGSFTTAGGNPAKYIAKWNGTTWSALGSGLGNSVIALAVSGTDLYVGGSFTTAGGNTANYVAKWNGTTWSALGSGLNGSVSALTVNGTDLFVGGHFTSAGYSSAKYIAKWDGSSWSALGDGLNNYVYALSVSGTDLYVGGYFTTAGGNAANRVAKWNGTTWSALGDGLNSYVYALTVNGTDLYVGGYFTSAGGSNANYVAKWNGNTWQPFNAYGTLGANSNVNTIAIMNNDIYVGGSFTIVGDIITANRIAKWNTINKTWSALGSGLDNSVNVLAVSGTDLYVGGSFASAGGNSNAKYIAKWNTLDNSWSALGTGLSGTVNALAISGTNLYVGGAFWINREVPIYNIARWNTLDNSWSALGSSLNSAVYVLAVSGTDLYVGGAFTDEMGSYLSIYNRIVKWIPGSGGSGTWSALGTGLNSMVRAIAIDGTDIYVGGDFTTAGDNTANYVAKWNGTAWSALGNGLNNTVNALAVSVTDLYVGGKFTDVYGGTTNTYNRLVKWKKETVADGTWSAITEGGINGVNEQVNTLCIDSDRKRMLAGGNFVTGGAKLLYYIGAFTDNDNGLPIELSTFTASVNEKGVTLNWVTTTEINNYGFEVERKTTNSDWVKIGFIEGHGNSNSPIVYNFTDVNAKNGINEYRLKQIDADGGYKYSQVVTVDKNENNILPKEYSLSQNYPNPFNPSTTINFSMPKNGKVTLEIYNTLGEKVTTLINKELNAGYHTVNFYAANMSSGVYIYRLQTGNYIQSKKMILEK